MNIEDIARICHEANRAYCKAFGDDSHLPWDSAPQWQRESAIMGVQAHMHAGGLDPEQSHNSWLAEKQRNGWVYGPVKDAEKKEHPCCVPYADLPVEQKAKDYIVGAIVAAVRVIDGEKLGDGVAGDRQP